MQTANGTKANVEKIAALFPNCVTETIGADGKPQFAVDFDQLRQELSSSIVEGHDERYQFTWPDKKKAILAANAPISATLRPCREESVDFDTTKNLYIEGDNLDVLKCLKETYSGKVKMIYIDPPYNTGNDFVYEDDFAESADEYLANSGQFDDQGNRLVTNTESNGRFHTDWLNMMYPRLKVARDLLKEDGAIFISIDDNEYETLTMLCNEIFGESCFITDIAWRSADSSNNDAKQFSADFNHTLVYSKTPSWQPYKLARSEKNNEHYKNPDNDPRGPWFSGNLSSPHPRANLTFDIISPNGTVIHPPKNGWRWSKEKIDEFIAKKEIVFSEDQTRIIKKTFLADQGGIVPSNIWCDLDETGHNRNAKYELKKLFPELSTYQLFSTPKPTKLINKILRISTRDEDIILDFFGGSCTTADSLFQVNAEDGGNRHFIIVQLQEGGNEENDVPDICTFGKERIRRAANKIKEDSGLLSASFDIGFRVLKLDSSNMLNVFYEPQEVKQQDLFGMADNIKSDRSAEDLLFQVMLELGVMLDSKIVESTIAGKKMFNVADGFLLACFDKDVNDAVITDMAKQQPAYAVLRDSSYADDSTATNFEQIFKTYSPNTIIKAL